MNDEQFAELSANEWRTVAEVARLEGLTQRAVQRRCQAGKYRTRRVPGEKGEVWEIEASSLVVNAQRSPNNHEDEERPFAHSSPNEGEPRSLSTGREKELREEILFLRGLVEAHQRSEAELRAALREALRAMPKELPTATTAPIQGASGAGAGHAPSTPPEAVESPYSLPLGPTGTPTGAAPPKEARTEPRPLWKLILGVR